MSIGSSRTVAVLGLWHLRVGDLKVTAFIQSLFKIKSRVSADKTVTLF
jgi:hypothetical protein